ncbi:ABC transporter substrate-binding protein [Acidovorax sp. sif1233]|uniref:ABC transporter substrate-binding protein n=1 Tax=Acidovorax sp. sif1233 TaxID=2854792 RepID=UPI001C46DAD1|nr:ABC transporter substrate-binding protein [Acidovorax sp. sif1233]MBV7454437.1 ABC transporter substrate-binding protein [Acidovorax sp. sif1233]
MNNKGQILGGGEARWSRRQLLRATGAATVVGASGVVGSHVLAAGKLREVKLAWNANAICLSAAPVAIERGIFEKHGLKVELVNFAGSTDQLLETIATSKADAGLGMVHRWIKPLESGFDVKLVGSSHGGCSRLVGYEAAGVTSLQKLKGKTIAVSDLNSPGKNFFSVLLTKAGLNPEKDVTWRQFPGDMLGLAVEKGEAQAIADGDPNLLLIQRRTKGLVDLASNLSGEYAAKTCCVLGVSGALVRNDKGTAAALTRAIIEASDFVADNPNETARIFSPYSKVPQDDLRAVLGTLTHRSHPVGTALRQEIEFYARDFKLVGVLKPSTDPARFAAHVHADVLA